MRVLVLADTHLRDGSGKDLPAAVWDAAARADVILHAGDVVAPGLLARLAEVAPVHAVLGNNDHGMVLPETAVLDLGGVTVGMIHDSGPTKGRAGRMHRRFPSAAVVVFGHSHDPVDEEGIGQRLFNPGSPTQRRRQPRCSYGELVLADGVVQDHRIVPL